MHSFRFRRIIWFCLCIKKQKIFKYFIILDLKYIKNITKQTLLGKELGANQISVIIY